MVAVDLSLLPLILGALLGVGGLGAVLVAVIQRHRPRAERAEAIIDQVQEERDRGARVLAHVQRESRIKSQIIHEHEVRDVVLQQHIYQQEPPPPPPTPDRILELKGLLLELEQVDLSKKEPK